MNRAVATMSGMTRCLFINPEVKGRVGALYHPPVMEAIANRMRFPQRCVMD
jgi:hypothetical protein